MPLSIRSSADMARMLASPIDVDLHRLLALRRDQLLEYDGYDLGDLVHIVIAQPGDTLDAIERAAGVALSTNLVDGTRYGDPDFTASFEFVQLHPGGIYEAVIVLSDDGFGLALFVPDGPDIDATLLTLFRDQA